MTTSLTATAIELALSDVLHTVAAGSDTDTLLHRAASGTLRVMGPDAASCVVLLGEPDTGFAVHAAVGPLTVPDRVLLGGPLLVSASSGAVSAVEDVHAAGARWAGWGADAGAAGVTGVRCWPVRVADRPLGALAVLTRRPWSAATRSSTAGQAMADVCSMTLQLSGPAQRWEQAVAQLRSTISLDAVVHQAMGMVAAASEVDIPAAAAALAAHADRIGTTAAVLARQVVTGAVSATEISAG